MKLLATRSSGNTVSAAPVERPVEENFAEALREAKFPTHGRPLGWLGRSMALATLATSFTYSGCQDAADQHADLSRPQRAPAKRDGSQGYSHFTSPGWECLWGPRSVGFEMQSPTKVRLAYAGVPVSEQSPPAWGITSNSAGGNEYQIYVLPPELREQFANGTLHCQLLLWTKEGEKVVMRPVASGDPNGLLFGLPAGLSFNCAAIEYLSFKSAAEIRSYALAEASTTGLRVLPEMVTNTPAVFSLESMTGRLISNKDFAGKILVIDQGFLRCHACMQMQLPALKEISDRLKDELAVIYVAHDSDGDFKLMLAELGDYAKRWEIVQIVPHSVQSGLWFQASLGTVSGAMPYVTVIGPDGIVADSWQGASAEHLFNCLSRFGVRHRDAPQSQKSPQR